jgi:hypothetical protein
VLGRQRPVFAQLFHAALIAGTLADDAVRRAAELAAAIPPDDLLDGGERRAFADMETFASTQNEARAIYAEVLVASVVRLLEDLKRQLGVDHAEAGDAIEGIPTSELLRCARNNFAHRHGWERPKGERERQRRDENIEKLRQAGITNPMEGDACYEAIRLICNLGVTQYLEFEDLLERMATEYYVKAGGRVEP